MVLVYHNFTVVFLKTVNCLVAKYYVLSFFPHRLCLPLLQSLRVGAPSLPALSFSLPMSPLFPLYPISPAVGAGTRTHARAGRRGRRREARPGEEAQAGGAAGGGTLARAKRRGRRRSARPGEEAPAGRRVGRQRPAQRKRMVARMAGLRGGDHSRAEERGKRGSTGKRTAGSGEREMADAWWLASAAAQPRGRGGHGREGENSTPCCSIQYHKKYYSIV